MDPEREPGILCKGIVVERIRFDDVPLGSRPPSKLDSETKIRRQMIGEGAAVEVTIDYRVYAAPDEAAWFNLELSVTGRFEADTAKPNIPLADFAQFQGPALVMPFVREMVANVTARSRHGLILLPPANIVALVQQEARAAIHAPTSQPATPSQP